jgi:hypothetical protein
LMAAGATNAEAMHYLQCSAHDLGSDGYDLTFGWGRLDAANALQSYANRSC